MSLTCIKLENSLSIWEQCLARCKAEVGIRTRDIQWVSAINYIGTENGKMLLEAPSEFAKEWFAGSFKSIFENFAKEIDQSIQEISITAKEIPFVQPPPPPKLTQPSQLNRCSFCKQYKLENFVAGTSNEFGLTCAKFIAEEKRERENFLILKSAPGLGKTHLLHAIGREASSKWAKNVVLWDSDKFFKEKRAGNLSKLMQADLFLLDNLQNLYTSVSAQEELLRIIKSLHAHKRSIVITLNPKYSSEMPINELADFLKVGIKCELKKPDLWTRTAILKQKAKEKKLPVELLENCWKPIAEQIGESVNALEGAINKLAAQQKLLKCEITPDMVLSQFVETKKTSKEKLSWKAIATATALSYGIPVDSLSGKTRTAAVSKPRQIAMYMCKQTGMSLKEIGARFNRDQSSVANAVHIIKAKIEAPNGYAVETEIRQIMDAALKL